MNDDGAHREDTVLPDRVDEALEAFFRGDSDPLARLADPVSGSAGSDALRAIREIAGHGADIPSGLDNFEISRELGRGGMGVVFEARQKNPARDVAIKVIRGGAASSDRQQRLFEREIETLARLNHPGIATLHEVGTTEDGDPYFVMELVRGHSLTEHAASVGDSSGSSTRAVILSLFERVCDAIAYAHRRGVIHRDLKPSNILVNERGDPKVLDFGLARFADHDAQQTTVTVSEGLIGTVPYMSPEQLASGSAEADTRSDVYALGVILYELLTERLPHDLTGSSIQQAVQRIREEPPVRPSLLRRELRGDLEMIVLTALSRDVDRRYQSVTALAEDVRRYLAGEPILARAPGALYLARRFAGRHRVLVAAGVIVAATLASATVLSSWLAVRATHAERLQRFERDAAIASAARAETNRAFLQRVISAPDPNLLGHDVTMLEALTRAAATVEADYGDDPGSIVEIRHTLAQIFNRLGEYDLALDQATRALAMWESLDAEDANDELSMKFQLAIALHETGATDRGIALCREIIDASRSDDPTQWSLMLDAMQALGDMLVDAGELDEAETVLLENLARRRTRASDDPNDVVTALATLAAVCMEREDADGAEELLLEAMEIIGADAEVSYDALVAMNNLATVRMMRGQFSEAESLLRKTVTELDRRVGAHPYARIALQNLGETLMQQGRSEEAVIYLARSLEVFDSFGVVLDSEALSLLWNLGLGYYQLERYGEAIPVLERLVREASLAFPPESEMHDMFAIHLGVSLTGENRPDEAEPLLLHAAQRIDARFPPGSEPHQAVHEALAMLYEATGRTDAAAAERALLNTP